MPADRIRDAAPARVRELVMRHPAVRAVRLVGSRAHGGGGSLSDWDLLVDASDPETVAEALPGLLAGLDPLAAQWDPLESVWCYMLIFPGPVKVDLLLDLAHEPEPPWKVEPSTMRAVDDHFWDWLLWIASKDVTGRAEVARGELARLGRHVLEPMGASGAPATIEDAAAEYRRARADREAAWDIVVPRALEREVVRGLRAHGYDVVPSPPG